MQCGFSNCIVPVLLHWKAIRNVGVGGIHPDPAESGTIITKRGGGRENNINLPTCNCNSTQQTELQNIGWWYTIWLSQRQKMVKLNWSNFPTIIFFLHLQEQLWYPLIAFLRGILCVWERDRASECVCVFCERCTVQAAKWVKLMPIATTVVDADVCIGETQNC